MLRYYYTYSYHPDTYLVGRVFCVFDNDFEYEVKKFTNYSPEVVHKNCQDYIFAREG